MSGRRRRTSPADFVPAYVPRPSALHSARPGAAAALCAALALPGLVWEHPLLLGAALAALAIAGAGAGVGEALARAALLALPLALLIALINPLVYQEGETVIFRGGELLGRRLDVTLEALAYGGVFGLRVMVLVLAFALFSAAVDPDEMLKLMRRVSYRSALTASLATRLVPLLARDALRMGDAARCRSRPPGRGQVARAALAGALDRAVDVAAALELRGYAGAARPRSARRPWSRHDLRVAGAAAGLAALVAWVQLAGAGGLDPYPVLTLELGPAELAACAAFAALAAVPFAGGAARLGVARA